MFIRKILPKYIQACPAAVSKFGAILHLRNSFPLGGWWEGGAAITEIPSTEQRRHSSLLCGVRLLGDRGYLLPSSSRLSAGTIEECCQQLAPGHVPVRRYSCTRLHTDTDLRYPHSRIGADSRPFTYPPPPGQLLRQDQFGAYKNLRTIFASGFSTYK